MKMVLPWSWQRRCRRQLAQAFLTMPTEDRPKLQESVDAGETCANMSTTMKTEAADAGH